MTTMRKDAAPGFRAGRRSAWAMTAWAALCLLVAPGARAQTGATQAAELQVYAAGSLRLPLTQIAKAFEQTEHASVRLTFGPSGVLRDRIAGGEAADVFASANVSHPETLVKAGRGTSVAVFARNRMCGLARGGVEVESATLLDRMLDPSVRLATSTPKADPAGDYAWQMFARAERVRPGAEHALQAKALQLVGGPTSPTPPADRSAYGALLATNQADLFITYCTNAAQAHAEDQALKVVVVPEELAVATAYGMTVVAPTDASRPLAQRFAAFMLAPAAQAVLQGYGFAAP